MSRILKLSYVSLFALLVVTFVVGRAAPKDPPKGDVKADEPLYGRLSKGLDFKGFDDPKTTLADALEVLSKENNLVFDINDRAFLAEQVQEVAKTLVAENPIAAMKNVRLETVLRKLLARVPVASGATFTVRRDRVEITTNQAQEREFWPNAPEGMEPVFPLIHGSYDKKPLDEALKDLSDRTDVTIVLDIKADEKLKPMVTARFANTPLDVAVDLMAEMNDLRSVALGKTLFVTTPDKADRLYKQAHAPAAGPMNPLGALGQLGVARRPGPAWHARSLRGAGCPGPARRIRRPTWHVRSARCPGPTRHHGHAPGQPGQLPPAPATRRGDVKAISFCLQQGA